MHILKDKIVKIRKHHSCWGCGREFPAGSTLRKVVTVDAGDFAHTYWCAVCNEMWEQRPMWLQEEGIGEGELFSNDPELWNEIADKVAAGITSQHDLGQLCSIEYVRCLDCQHSWLAIYHADTINKLECPKCGAQNSEDDNTQK